MSEGKKVVMAWVTVGVVGAEGLSELCSKRRNGLCTGEIQELNAERWHKALTHRISFGNGYYCISDPKVEMFNGI